MMMGYFLDNHVKVVSPMNNAYPEVLLQSSMSLHQSLSMKACKFKFTSLSVEQYEVICPLDIYENLIYCFQVRVFQILHESAYDPHDKCYFASCASQVP
jgi:hypothetical protein